MGWLAGAMLGRALGAGPIIATDIAPERRTIAENLGLVDHALPADDTAAAAITELTGGRRCERDRAQGESTPGRR